MSMEEVLKKKATLEASKGQKLMPGNDGPMADILNKLGVTTAPQSVPSEGTMPKDSNSVLSGTKLDIPLDALNPQEAVAASTNTSSDNMFVDHMQKRGESVTAEVEAVKADPDRLKRMQSGIIEDAAKNRSGAGAFTVAAIDMASMGLADNSGAAMKAAWDKLTKGADFSDTYKQAVADTNLMYEYNLKHNTKSAIAGSIAGAFIPGMASAQALGKVMAPLGRAFPRTVGNKVVRNVAIPSVVAGVETALYRANSGGTRDEVVNDGLMGMVGGAVLGTAFGVGSHAVKRFRGTDTFSSLSELGRMMHKAINNTNRLNAKPGETGIPSAILKRINDEGGDTVLADVYPELVDFLKYAASSTNDTKGVKRLTGVLAARNTVAVDYPQLIRKNLNEGLIRSKAAFANVTKKAQEKLRPQFSEAVSRIDRNYAPFKYDRVKKMLIDAYGDVSSDQTARAGRDKVLNMLKRHRTLGADGKPINEITAGSLQALRTEMNSMKGVKIKKARQVWKLGMNKAIRFTGDLLGAYDDQYKALNHTFAETNLQRDAFNKGFDFFTPKASASNKVDAINDELLELFKMENYSVMNSFVHGAKSSLYENIANKRTAKAMADFLADNSDRIQNMQAILGKQNVDEIIQHATNVATREQLQKTLETAMTKGLKEPITDVTRKEMGDIQIMMGAPGSPAGKRAISRLLTGWQPGDTPSPTQLRANEDMVGNFASMPVKGAKDIEAILKELGGLAKNSRTANDLGKAAGVPASLAAGLAGHEQSLEDEVIKYFNK